MQELRFFARVVVWTLAVSFCATASLLPMPAASAEARLDSASEGRPRLEQNARVQRAKVQMDGAAGETERILHLLNRITFGPRPGDVEAVRAMGIDAFIQQQLTPESIQSPPILTDYVSQIRALHLEPGQMFLQYGPPAAKRALGLQGQETKEEKQDQQKMLRDNYKGIYEQVSEARLRRAIDSPGQLQQVMTDFWFNHFNISADKGFDHLWIGDYEEQAIRPFALGRFRDLLGATCHHAGMLFYLDNWQNTAPQSRGSRGKFSGLNENYARELMELHTLGVDGGYTQKDVIELARVLTGLGLSSGRGGLFSAYGPSNSFGYRFDPNRHDFGQKQILGRTIQGSGEKEIEEALDMLSRHPSTAHHVCYQLAQYFVADVPPPALVDKLAAKFLESDGNIRAVLSELFHSPEFWDAKNFNNKYKSPYRFVISSVRAGNVSLTNLRPITGFLGQQGMPLYRCLTPDGYKNTQDAWLNPDSMLRRISFATGVGTGHLPQNQFPPLDYKELERTLGGNLSQSTVSAVEQAPMPLKSALILGSPEFMHY